MPPSSPTRLGIERCEPPSTACSHASLLLDLDASRQGAVRAYIGLERVKEALSSAKEALQRMPRNGARQTDREGGLRRLMTGEIRDCEGYEIVRDTRLCARENTRLCGMRARSAHGAHAHARSQTASAHTSKETKG